ncbi:unnamed protein product [Hermetia illucens]|uniref:Uncharacterized protein n=1 Tax=Hermetia illucens TaxID=343691 RepID=A0A7R8UXM2_HERIL|nr:unnamed protein product [Hermetia illucens]
MLILSKFKGTFLVNFSNATITVNDYTFSANEVSNLHALPSVFQPTPHEEHHGKILPLQLMEEMHLNNTHHIRLLEKDNQIATWTNNSVIVAVILISIIIIFLGLRRKKASKIIIEQQLKEDIDPGQITTKTKSTIPEYVTAFPNNH